MIKPIGKNILFEPLKEKLEGMAAVAYGDANAEMGKVLAIGPDVQEVKVGETIYFKGYGVTKNENGSDVHYFVREDDYILLGVLHE